MIKFFRIFFILVLTITLFSCSKTNNPTITFSIRDYAAQYADDKVAIETFLRNHKFTNDSNFNVTFSTTIPDAPDCIYRQTDYPLLDTLVVQNGVDYHIKYIRFSQGLLSRPTQADSIYVSYRGRLLDTETAASNPPSVVDYSAYQFDSRQNPIWLSLTDVISGWRHIFPNFKTGTFSSGGANPTNFANFGAGIMFLPSGLGYYANSAGIIPQYAPLIFTFKLYHLRYRDQDGDGILSKDERLIGTNPLTNWTSNPLGYDTDGDGVWNMYDVDDDGDNYSTKFETKKTGTDIGVGPSLYYPFNFTIQEPNGIPDCAGDKTSPTRLRKHLDPNCH